MTEAVPTLSTGQPSTFGSYLDNCKALGLDKAVAFLEDKIRAAKDGRDEVVIVDESQMLYLIMELERKP